MRETWVKYPDRDTVPFAEGLRIVDHLVATGYWPPDADRVADRVADR